MKKGLSKNHPAVLSAALITLLAVSLVMSKEGVPGKPAELIKRGAYLVNLGGCNDCHTPKIFTQAGPMPDTSRLLCGHQANTPLPPVPNGLIAPDKWGALTNNDFTAWAGLWGISFAANLTPDSLTGLGKWTEDSFVWGMRSGKHQGVGRDILPPMPWPGLAALPDEDLKSIFAYLKSIKPIKNEVPAPIIATGK